jgi:lysyl-tRNA synthetase class 2
LSRKHNPEFTMLELYWAYADYHDIMTLVETLVSDAATSMFGRPEVKRDESIIDLTPPWPRQTLREAILQHSGIDFAVYPPGDEGDLALLAAARARGAQIPDGTPRGKLIDELLSTFVESHLVSPVFLFDYPIELSPLAKTKANDPRLVERFEAFAGGIEIANAFSELNDPLEQRRRFEAQARDRAAGDLEAQLLDEEFLEAMEHGMPPAGGLGIGIDRLAMFFTGADTIRDVILFPQLRREGVLERDDEPDGSGATC